MTTSIKLASLLHSRADLRHGRPCLAGTGMTVHAVAVQHIQGPTAERILEQSPHVDLARIYAALAYYYYANRAQIEADLEEEDHLAAKLMAKYPDGWGPDTKPR